MKKWMYELVQIISSLHQGLPMFNCSLIWKKLHDGKEDGAGWESQKERVEFLWFFPLSLTSIFLAPSSSSFRTSYLVQSLILTCSSRFFYSLALVFSLLSDLVYHFFYLIVISLTFTFSFIIQFQLYIFIITTNF